MKQRISFLYRRGVKWISLDIKWYLMNFILLQMDSFYSKWFLSHIFNNSMKSAFIWNLYSFRICAHMKSSVLSLWYLGWLGIKGGGQHGGHLIFKKIIWHQMNHLTSNESFHIKTGMSPMVPRLVGDIRRGPAWGPLNF